MYRLVVCTSLETGLRASLDQGASCWNMLPSGRAAPPRAASGRRGSPSSWRSTAAVCTLLLLAATAGFLLRSNVMRLHQLPKLSMQTGAGAASLGAARTSSIAIRQRLRRNSRKIARAPVQNGHISALPAVEVPLGEPSYAFASKGGASDGLATAMRGRVQLPLILTDANLAAVAAHHLDRSSGAVAINTFRGGIKPLELSFAQNMLVQFAKVGLGSNLMVVCSTRTTAINAWREGVPLYLSALTHAAKPASDDPVILKWLLAARLAELNHSVLFVDFDLGLRCNPYTLFQPKLHDIEILWDMYYMDQATPFCTNPVSTSNGGKVQSGACASTGFWIAHAGKGLAPFLQHVYSCSVAGKWEQYVFNLEVLTWDMLTNTSKRTANIEEEAQTRRIHLRLLRQPHFMNILNLPQHLKFDNVTSEGACMLHCGVISGGEGKAKSLRAVGMFSPELYAVVKASLTLNEYGAEVVIPYFDPKRTDTIWL